MRLIGLLGGLSWESTAIYYRLMNRDVSTRLGGLHSARLLIHSFDFAEIAELQSRGGWAEIGERLAEAAAGLESVGAEMIVLGSNTLHYVAPAIETAIRVPLLHIVDPTGEALRRAGVRCAGFLGTRYSMELPFWPDRLMARFGVELVMPDAAARALVHRVIYEELCVGRLEETSRAAYGRVIDQLRASGAEAVILGCTEIGLLIGAADSSLRIFDTTVLHAAAAVDASLARDARGAAALHAAPVV
jgi:aspartate racemase